LKSGNDKESNLYREIGRL